MGAGVLLAALALGAPACHRRPLQPADAAPADGAQEDVFRCGETVSDDPELTFSGLSNGPGTADVGRVLIEESTPASLVLSFVERPGSPPRPRVTLHGAPAPTLPVGRLAWFVHVVSNDDTFGLRESSWAFSVRDFEGGTILFGAAHEHPGEGLTPFPIGALTSLCTYGDCPRTNEQALTVLDASPATIPNGGSATVTIGAHAYHLWVHAKSQSLGTCDAASFVPPLPLVLTYVANDLADLAAGLAAPPQ